MFILNAFSKFFMYLFNSISRFLFDILRDKNTKKYSTTKAVAVSTTVYLFAAFTIGLGIMINKQEIDHWLIGEMIGFVLTLLGFKNFRSSSQTGIDVPAAEEPTEKPKRHAKEAVEEGVF